MNFDMAVQDHNSLPLLCRVTCQEHNLVAQNINGTANSIYATAVHAVAETGGSIGSAMTCQVAQKHADSNLTSTGDSQQYRHTSGYKSIGIL